MSWVDRLRRIIELIEQMFDKIVLSCYNKGMEESQSKAAAPF